jgi:hypothetical protein
MSLPRDAFSINSDTGASGRKTSDSEQQIITITITINGTHHNHWILGTYHQQRLKSTTSTIRIPWYSLPSYEAIAELTRRYRFSTA